MLYALHLKSLKYKPLLLNPVLLYTAPCFIFYLTEAINWNSVASRVEKVCTGFKTPLKKTG